MEERAASLNSGDCFVLLTPGTMFVWQGRGSNADEQEVSLRVAERLQVRGRGAGAAGAGVAGAGAAQCCAVG